MHVCLSCGRYAAEDAAAEAIAEAARCKAEEERQRGNIVTPRLDQDRRIQSFLGRAKVRA